jgi:hypothetical protein
MRKFKVYKAAVARVLNPLPIPTICPNCGGPVAMQSNSVVYRKEYGQWPFLYRCQDATCDSYVGLHPKTDIPLGTLANKETRDYRKKAKGLLMPMWEEQGMDRTDVYAWLAGKMGIADVNQCHIGWFNIEQCKQVIQICNDNQGNKA